MDRKKIITRMVYLIFLIFLLNSLADTFYWYSSVWYFDMPMHFLGGIFLGLGSLYLVFPKELDFKSVFKVMLIVFAVAIAWEVFEVIVDKNLTKNGFNLLDTISDIFFGLGGGMTAVFYYFKRVMSVPSTKV